jgi:hypothetical protein
MASMLASHCGFVSFEFLFPERYPLRVLAGWLLWFVTCNFCSFQLNSISYECGLAVVLLGEVKALKLKSFRH